LIQREKWSDKKKLKYANKVVDEMEQNGEIHALYRDFSLLLKEAREGKVKGRKFDLSVKEMLTDGSPNCIIEGG
jgi:hypothetical protein